MAPERVPIDGGWLDLEAQRFHGPHGEGRLTDRERRLVRVLLEAGGEPVSRRQLLSEVLGYSPRVQSRALALVVLRLRRKIERDPSDPRHLLTAFGQGYRFVAGGASPMLLGREKLLATLRQDLRDVGLVVLHGGPGSGRTTVGEALLERWPDGGRLVALNGTCARGLEAAFALALGPGELEDQMAGLRGALLVLDDADGLASELGARWESWRALAPGLSVLALCLGPCPDPEVVQHRLDELDSASAVALFDRCCQEASWAPSAEHTEAVLAWLGGNPLALVLAARRGRLLGPDALLARGAEALGGRALARSLGASWGLLEEGDQRALAALSALPAPAPVEILEAAIGGDEALDRVDRLWRHGLLQVARATPARLGVIGAVRAFARDQVPDVDGLSQASDALAALATSLLRVRGTARQELAESQVPNLLAVLSAGRGRASVLAGALAIDALADRAPSGVVRQLLRQRGGVGDPLALALSAAALLFQHGALSPAELDGLAREAFDASALCEPWVQAWVRLEYALHAGRSGRSQEAVEAAEEAQSLAAGHGFQRLEAMAWLRLGSGQLFGPSPAGAEPALLKAAGLLQQACPRLASVAREGLGILYGLTGRPDLAAEELERALEGAEPRQLATRLGNLAYAEAVLGRDEAWVHAESARERHGRLGDTGWVLRLDALLGALALAEGRPHEARVRLEPALDQARRRGSEGLEAPLAIALAVARAAEGDEDGALAVLEGPLDGPQVYEDLRWDLRAAFTGERHWRRAKDGEERPERLLVDRAMRGVGLD